MKAVSADGIYSFLFDAIDVFHVFENFKTFFTCVFQTLMRAHNARIIYVMYNYLIFDLDGTILDTIDDITFAINSALEQKGYPWRYDREGTKTLVGDGADALLHRALRNHDNPEEFQLLKPVYMALYKEHQTERAKPFLGLNAVLTELKNQGIRMAVVTNKPDALAQVIVPMHFGEGFFERIYGINEGDPVKPNPAFVFKYLNEVGAKPEECLFIGDSHVDIATGHNAGMKVLLCGWGYEVDYEAVKNDADFFAETPEELKRVIR